MNCPKCGNPVIEGSAFCENCGASLAAPSVETATAAAVSMAAAAAAADQTVAGAAPAAPAAGQYAQYSQNGPSVHYSSQQAYNQGKTPGYTAQQPNYQQYQQPNAQQQYQQPQAAQKIYAPTTGTSRALAMSVYWGLLPLIFAWVVGDKDTDPFLKHHLNQGLVLLIAGLISGFLAFVIIGGLLAIAVLVFMVMGTLQAYHGEVTELPFIGKIKILK